MKILKKITGLEIYKEYKSIDLRIKGRIYLGKKMFNLKKDNPITIFDIGNSKITCLILRLKKQNKNPWFGS